MSALDRAVDAWGKVVPDWVKVLAEECDRTSQKAVSSVIGYSAATVSLIISRTYPGDLTRVEQTIRGALMNATVDCPVVGQLATDLCQQHQKRPFAAHNPQRIAFYRACRSGCPHSRLERSVP